MTLGQQEMYTVIQAVHSNTNTKGKLSPFPKLARNIWLNTTIMYSIGEESGLKKNAEIKKGKKRFQHR